MHWVKSNRIIFLFLLFCSCSPQKRLNRIIKNHPELLEQDTITIVDTVVIESYTFDTITQIRLHDSTIIVNNERIFAKYFYDTLRQEIIHEIQCKDDSIIIERQIPVEKIVYRDLSWWQKYRDLLIIIAIIILALVVFKNFKKIIP